MRCQLFFPGTLAGFGRQRGDHPMQVVVVLSKLIGQRLAPHVERLPVHALLLQLAAQQLRLLLGLGAALLGIAQFAVGIFQRQTRLTQFVVHRHAPFEQLFELDAQLFQRRLALFEVQRQLLTPLVQTFGLQLQTLQRPGGWSRAGP
jgi:hypothetical protein